MLGYVLRKQSLGGRVRLAGEFHGAPRDRDRESSVALHHARLCFPDAATQFCGLQEDAVERHEGGKLVTEREIGVFHAIDQQPHPVVYRELAALQGRPHDVEVEEPQGGGGLRD